MAFISNGTFSFISLINSVVITLFNTLYTFTPKIFQNKLNEKYMKNMIDSKFYLKTNTNLNNSEINKINNTISTSNIGIIQKAYILQKDERGGNLALFNFHRMNIFDRGILKLKQK